LLVDATQSAGSFPMDMGRMGIHMLAAPGHKGLLGPQGTGILLVDSAVSLRPIREGGTGFLASDLDQPVIFPEGFESGTLNVPGIAGLGAGIRYLQSTGLAMIHNREIRLAGVLVDGLRAIPGVTVHGPQDPTRRCAAVCFTVGGLDPGEVEERLDEEFGIIGRAGLHCNPGAHVALGTHHRGGAMRLSPGFSNTEDDVERAIETVTAVAVSVRLGTGGGLSGR